jgi:2-oxoglutarate dehydrogenase complex dehydrogenase (E1) component-like enzyme
MEVVYPSTAAQVFHMFRRQMLRGFRKPLVVMTPKVMLRATTSRWEELTTGSFEEFLDDPAFGAAGGAPGSGRSAVKRVVLVSGKLYWELEERRRAIALKDGREDVAIVRVEQFYPFHKAKLAEILSRYPKSAELCYAQEEPMNQGGYRFVDDVLRREMGIAGGARYIGRGASCSPATGSKKQHKVEQEAILTAAIGPKPQDAGTDGVKDKTGEPAKVGAGH